MHEKYAKELDSIGDDSDNDNGKKATSSNKPSSSTSTDVAIGAEGTLSSPPTTVINF